MLEKMLMHSTIRRSRALSCSFTTTVSNNTLALKSLHTFPPKSSRYSHRSAEKKPVGQSFDKAASGTMPQNSLHVYVSLHRFCDDHCTNTHDQTSSETQVLSLLCMLTVQHIVRKFDPQLLRVCNTNTQGVTCESSWLAIATWQTPPGKFWWANSPIESDSPIPPGTRPGKLSSITKQSQAKSPGKLGRTLSQCKLLGSFMKACCLGGGGKTWCSEVIV